MMVPPRKVPLVAPACHPSAETQPDHMSFESPKMEVRGQTDLLANSGTSSTWEVLREPPNDIVRPK